MNMVECENCEFVNETEKEYNDTDCYLHTETNEPVCRYHENAYLRYSSENEWDDEY